MFVALALLQGPKKRWACVPHQAIVSASRDWLDRLKESILTFAGGSEDGPSYAWKLASTRGYL